MPSKKKEPKRLIQGKRFHEKVQADWHNTADGEVESEKSITKPGGRRGRMDIFVTADNNMVAIAEIKDSNWDAMTLTNVRRNVKRQARQIWKYIDAQLKSGTDISTGIIFKKRPKDKDRMILIEKLFDEEGIPVVWEDESGEERKERG